MTTSFITNTASLKTTIADVRKLNAKKIFLGGQNILDIIKRATPTVKHSQDTRTKVTENDLWGQWVETEADGTIIVHDDWVTNPNGSNYEPWDTSLIKVEDNKVYNSSGFCANIQIQKIKDGSNMFERCSKLTTFKADLSNLTNGSGMFDYCFKLESFRCNNLSSLTCGATMFSNCGKFTSFFYDLPSLTNGKYMFSNCYNLKTFSSNLSSLTNGEYMFSDCTALKSFNGDLSSLIHAPCMFNKCTKLKSFNGDLSSLMYGGSMFSACMLDAESVMYIADTVKDIAAEKQLYIDGTIPYVTETNNVYSAPKGYMENGEYVYTFNGTQHYTTTIFASDIGLLTLGINVSNNSSTIQQQLEDFAKEATFDSWADLKTYFSNKGWTVTFRYGGTTTNITYGLRDGEQIIPCQIFAKLVQVEDKDSAEYCTEDASTFYNIEWGHDVTDTSSYTQFDSLEDAMAHWNVFPKENIISTEEEEA